MGTLECPPTSRAIVRHIPSWLRSRGIGKFGRDSLIEVEPISRPKRFGALLVPAEAASITAA